MPVSSSVDRWHYAASVERVLREWLQDFFPPAAYVITFEPPGPPMRPTLWFQWLPGRDRAIRERAGNRTVQGKQLTLAVSALAGDRATVLEMTDRLEQAVLQSASTLGAAGMRYVQIQPFEDVLVDADAVAFRRMSALTCTVTI